MRRIGLHFLNTFDNSFVQLFLWLQDGRQVLMVNLSLHRMVKRTVKRTERMELHLSLLSLTINFRLPLLNLLKWFSQTGVNSVSVPFHPLLLPRTRTRTLVETTLFLLRLTIKLRMERRSLSVHSRLGCLLGSKWKKRLDR